MQVAIVSPSTCGKPETFVESHIQGIHANVTYYYGDTIPRYIRGEGLYSMDNRNVGNLKAWRHVLATTNPLKFRSSGIGLKNYLFAHSLKKHHIDVVLAEYGTTGAEVLPACMYAGIPLVAHFHGRDCSCNDVVAEYANKYKALFRGAAYVVAVSHQMEEKLAALGCPPEKIVYCPCVPDSSFYELRPSLDGLQLAFVGRFTDKKAPYATLLAFRKVMDSFPAARLVMAGDGPLLNTTRNMAKILGIASSVEFPGSITPKQTRELLMRSRAYVQHSIVADDGDMEGTPVAVMEASAAGLPVISTRHAGIPDVVKDGETGLLCNELDVNAMAKNMLRVLEDKEYARRLGNAGKKFMRTSYSKEWQMDTLTSILQKSVKEKGE